MVAPIPWANRFGGPGTYFAGNNRHRGFDKVIEDIERLLKMEPRTRDA